MRFDRRCGVGWAFCRLEASGSRGTPFTLQMILLTGPEERRRKTLMLLRGDIAAAGAVAVAVAVIAAAAASLVAADDLAAAVLSPVGGAAATGMIAAPAAWPTADFFWTAAGLGVGCIPARKDSILFFCPGRSAVAAALLPVEV